MSDIPVGTLGGVIFLLILLSGFFSGSETALMSLNRYRLRHLSQAGHRGARLAEKLLARPDRIIGLILLGNNFVNILASMLTGALALRLGGETAFALATIPLTATILIFAEVAPKTLAALHPERVAFPASYVYYPLLKVMYPVIWVLNGIANGLLRMLGVHSKEAGLDALSSEELRTVVMEAGAMIPQRHQKMLLAILDIEKVEVDDVMVPRNEIEGIDLAEGWEKVAKQLRSARHTRLPVYHGDADNIEGMVHSREVIRQLVDDGLTEESFRAAIEEPYYIPEGTPLNRQLLNFQANRQRVGLVVDEYGDILGLVTLEDILEEIVGELSPDAGSVERDVFPEGEGSYLVKGSAGVRNLNRSLGWDLPVDGPRTINGLILEHLETIPEPGTTLTLSGHSLEVVQTTGSAVKTVRIRPVITGSEPDPDEDGGSGDDQDTGPGGS